MSRRARRRQAAAAELTSARTRLAELEHQSAVAIERTRTAYDSALADSGVVLFQQTAPNVDCYHVSPSVVPVLGWQPVVFLTPGIFRGMVHPDDLAAFDSTLVPGARPLPAPTTVIDLTSRSTTTVTHHGFPLGDDGATAIVRFRSASGPWVKVQVRIADDAASVVTSGSLIDVTSDELARTATRRFAELMELDPAGSLVLEFLDPSDPDTLVIRAANRSAHRMFNLERKVVDGLPLEAVLGTPSAQLIRSALFDVSHTGEAMTAERISLTEVRGTYLDLRVDRLSDGTLGMTVADVTGTVALEERLRHQASHDALTALPNRSLLEERLSSAVATVTASSPVALIVIDIDGLSEINDSLGLQLGDQLLVEFGRRLVREVRGAAIVSRIGGDEFALLTMACSSDAEALERAVSVRRSLDRPFDIGGHIVSCRASIGVALAPTHGDDGRSLLRFANLALDHAKRSGSGFELYERNEESSSIHRLALLAELRQGLANRDLELRFQPMVDLRTGRVDKVEAVLRWQRDQDGVRLPMEFLELAEQSGLIQPLNRWILGEAARAASTLSDSDRSVVVSTNLSMKNLADPDLISFLELLITSGELRPELIELEVGEVELMDDPVQAQETLSALSALGLRFTVDDFGTGYTSLSTMQHLPVSGLKIDRTFIATLSSVPADAAIVRSTIELCHDLGLTAGADGVADATTLSMLAGFGCDSAQGFHLSEPVTLAALPARVAELEHAVRGWVGSADSSGV